LLSPPAVLIVAHQALRYAYDFSGPDRLLFGTDHPWISINSFVELVEDLAIPAADTAKLFGSDAAELSNIV
jgi:predicted TIM-barrel fold metal-dependent hydrolase